MAARPGEDIAASLYADVHYFYGPPTSVPLHHRFDKTSYVYLFENAPQRRARIEIANHAGTLDQDAFSGFLDGVRVKYSYKHSTLVTLTIDHCEGQEWHLPAFDLRNEKKYMYKLHMVDLYFWTYNDATQFMNGIRRLLPQQQITILDELLVPPEHHTEMSPIVQKLENISIFDPAYQHGQTRNSRSMIVGPPISALPQSHQISSYTPMPYNPAAPPAPETIHPRDRTPPPEDGNDNPLSDYGQSLRTLPQTQLGSPPQEAYSTDTNVPNPNLPVSAISMSPSSSSIIVAHHEKSHLSFSPPPTAPLNPASFPPPPVAHQDVPPHLKSESSHIPVTQCGEYTFSPGYPCAVSTPGLSSSGYSSPMTTTDSSIRYHYPNNSSNNFSHTTDHAIYQQVYKPSEHEPPIKIGKPTKAPTGKLEERATKLEKGMGNLFKKLEKKIG